MVAFLTIGRNSRSTTFTGSLSAIKWPGTYVLRQTLLLSAAISFQPTRRGNGAVLEYLF